MHLSLVTNVCLRVLPGGSTIVVLFEKGVVEWDEDLLINSRACLETLVRVGMGLGRSQRKPITDGNGVAGASP